MLKLKGKVDMYGRVIFIAIITALGHFLSVVMYPILARYLSPDTLADIGLIDANIMLVVGWLGFGLTATATRDIALSKNWKTILVKAQSARMTMALVFSTVSAFAFIIGQANEVYFWLVLLFAPIVALNYDFALYALGKPLQAAIISFVRQSLPIIIFLFVVLLVKVESWYYLFASFTFLFIASWLVSHVIGSTLLFTPNKSFLLTYWNSVGLGIAGLFLGLQRYGFVNIYSGRLSDSEFVVLMTFLKVILFFVACKRMLIQIFYSKLLEKRVSFMVDLFALVSASTLFIICFAFSSFISSHLFGSVEYSSAVEILAVGVFSCLFFVTADSRLLLFRRDKLMSYSTVAIGFLSVSVLYLFREHLGLEQILKVVVLMEFLLALIYWVCSLLSQEVNKENIA